MKIEINGGSTTSVDTKKVAASETANSSALDLLPSSIKPMTDAAIEQSAETLGYGVSTIESTIVDNINDNILASYPKDTYGDPINEDPNATLKKHIFTTHVNCPSAGLWCITTLVVEQGITTADISTRTQIAVSFTNTQDIQTRVMTSNNVWSAWVPLMKTADVPTTTVVSTGIPSNSPNGRPFLYDNLMFITSSTDYAQIEAIDLDTNTVVGVYDIRSVGFIPVDSSTSSATINALYAANANETYLLVYDSLTSAVFCFDIVTGGVVWKYNLGGNTYFALGEPLSFGRDLEDVTFLSNTHTVLCTKYLSNEEPSIHLIDNSTQAVLEITGTELKNALDSQLSVGVEDFRYAPLHFTGSTFTVVISYLNQYNSPTGHTLAAIDCSTGNITLDTVTDGSNFVNCKPLNSTYALTTGEDSSVLWDMSGTSPLAVRKYIENTIHTTFASSNVDPMSSDYFAFVDGNSLMTDKYIITPTGLADHIYVIIEAATGVATYLMEFPYSPNYERLFMVSSKGYVLFVPDDNVYKIT